MEVKNSKNPHDSNEPPNEPSNESSHELSLESANVSKSSKKTIKSESARNNEISKQIVRYSSATNKSQDNKKSGFITRFIRKHVDSIPLSTKLVACTLVVLTVAAFCISLSIRQLVGNYLLEKTDAQLTDQAQLVYDNIDFLRSRDARQSTVGPNDYFLQVRDINNRILATPLVPPLKGNVTSVPTLPEDGSLGNVSPNKPFTTPAQVHGNLNNIDDATAKIASAPWRVLVLTWGQKNRDNSSSVNTQGYVYIALSLSDQLDTINTLTQYCLMVSIAVILFGIFISILIIQSTLIPLKRIEKTASKIASGDLSKRVQSAPENTEIGSLAASLNSMLSRIERSFNEQELMTEKMKRFVSDASHELRTPLAIIHGYVELYEMWRKIPGSEDKVDDAISHIKSSTERMTELVEDLLSLARLDEGRGIDISQNVNLSSIVSDAANDLHALDPVRIVQLGNLTLPDDWKTRDSNTGQCEHKLIFKPGNMPKVVLLADGARLRQVMTNIVGNIHRYTPIDSPVEVGISIMKASIEPEKVANMDSVSKSLKEFLEAIEVSQTTGSGIPYAVIRVIDHGKGVPEESLPHIFERFYSADPSRAREKGGTGLGMAIVQSVVKAHNGFICATTSAPGISSTAKSGAGDTSDTNIDDTMNGTAKLDLSGAHGLTLTIVLPIQTLEEN